MGRALELRGRPWLLNALAITLLPLPGGECLCERCLLVLGERRRVEQLRERGLAGEVGVVQTKPRPNARRVNRAGVQRCAPEARREGRYRGKAAEARAVY